MSSLVQAKPSEQMDDAGADDAMSRLVSRPDHARLALEFLTADGCAGCVEVDDSGVLGACSPGLAAQLGIGGVSAPNLAQLIVPTSDSALQQIRDSIAAGVPRRLRAALRVRNAPPWPAELLVLPSAGASLLLVRPAVAMPSGRRVRPLEESPALQPRTDCSPAGGTCARVAARESAELLHQLALNLREVFWVSDPEFSEVLYVSPAFEQLWGMPPTCLYGNPMTWREAVLEEDRAIVDEQLSRQAQGRSCEAEFRIRLPDGGIRWIGARSFPWLDAQGGVRVGGIAKDITRRRQAEEARLAQAERQREALIREIHHRMKNSLQGVCGLLERFTQRHPELADALGEAMAQVCSIATIHALQSRSPDGRVLLCELIPTIADKVQSLFESPIRIEVNNRRTCVAIVTDREAVPLAIAINELLMNAIKHRSVAAGRDECAVMVSVGGDEKHAEIRIVNQGALPQGFDFECGSAVGLGLGLVHALLPPHGAAVRFAESGGKVEATLRLTPPVIRTDPRQSPRV